MPFSEIALKLTKEKKKDELMKFAGIWDKEFAEKVKKEIYKERKIK